MKNSRILVLLAVVALCSTAAFAQSPDQPRPERRSSAPDGPGFGPGGPRGGGFLPPSLNLTADQKTQLEAIRKEEHTAMKNLDEQSLTGQQRRQQMHQIRQGSQQKIESILTPDQKAKLEAERANHQRGPGGPGGPRGDMMRRQPPPQSNQ